MAGNVQLLRGANSLLSSSVREMKVVSLDGMAEDWEEIVDG